MLGQLNDHEIEMLQRGTMPSRMRKRVDEAAAAPDDNFLVTASRSLCHNWQY